MAVCLRMPAVMDVRMNNRDTVNHMAMVKETDIHVVTREYRQQSRCHEPPVSFPVPHDFNHCRQKYYF
ncbi:hypothetical protein Barb6_03881 [Bacteroidales bacterium Barb6]|nr:hypothetical protein Barb6_03881 [Bacteroidales bacterium Barb6]